MDLIIPDYNFYESYKEAIKEYKEHNIDTYSFFLRPETIYMNNLKNLD